MATGERGKAADGYAPALGCGGRRFAPTPLRCSASWPAEQLASLPAVVPLKQSRRVRRRSALTRAAMSLALLSAASCRCRRTPTHGFTSSTEVFVDKHQERLCAVGGARG